ncbi:MAG: hypothetical protein WBQ18_09445 [Solirubrobacteraceae bacterium]
MSAVAARSRLVRGRERPRAACAPTSSAGVGGEPTLDTLVSGVWEGLVAHRVAACPMCGGEMAPDYGVHALPVGGTCGSCGTRLA